MHLVHQRRPEITARCADARPVRKYALRRNESGADCMPELTQVPQKQNRTGHPQMDAPSGNMLDLLRHPPARKEGARQTGYGQPPSLGHGAVLDLLDVCCTLEHQKVKLGDGCGDLVHRLCVLLGVSEKRGDILVVKHAADYRVLSV